MNKKVITYDKNGIIIISVINRCYDDDDDFF